MNLPPGLLGSEWTIAGWLLLAIVVIVQLRATPWRQLFDEVRFNVWLGAIVSLAVLWSMQAGVKPGLNLHLLGATVLVLLFRQGLAFFALCLVLAAVTFNRGGGWESFGLNALLLAGLPVYLSRLVIGLVAERLPKQVFVFILANGFFGAALTITLTGAAGAFLLGLAGIYSPNYLLDEYLLYFLLLAFAEGWMSGIATTLLVVYRPQWVATFDAREYFVKP